MIDIHCHIIPKADDGAGSLEESLEMARMALADGIREIVATPHTQNGVHENRTSDVVRAVEGLRSAFETENLPLKLYAGSEIHVTSKLTMQIKAGELCTFNNQEKYALLELPSQSVPDGLQHEIFELKLGGITPIIAHPERNAPFQKDPELLAGLIRMGALAQVTAMALMGDFGPPVREFAVELIGHRLVQLMATDAHSAGGRPPLLSHAVEEAARILGNIEEAEAMVTDRPAAILQGIPFDCPEPLSRKKPLPSRPFKRLSRLWRTCFHFT